MPKSHAEKLSPRAERFVLEYLKDLNATAAATRAGYSAANAHNRGHKLLKNPAVMAEIRKRQGAVLQKLEITVERTMQEVARVAYSDMRHIVEWNKDGIRLKASSDLSDYAAAAVAEVSETATQFGGSKRIKLHSKVDALDKLMRHFGLMNGDAAPGDPEGKFVMVGVVKSVSAEEWQKLHAPKAKPPSRAR